MSIIIINDDNDDGAPTAAAESDDDVPSLHGVSIRCMMAACHHS